MTTSTISRAERQTPNAVGQLSWNDDLALWGREGPGHTRAASGLGYVHSGVESAVKLHALLQLNRISEKQVEEAAEGLLRLQICEGEKTGCFRWYAEEAAPTDTNASFFIGLALQLLVLGYQERLSPKTLASLRDCFRRLNSWALWEIEHADVIYPNKYLGDIVVAWLGHELTEAPAPDVLIRRMHAAAAYWKETRWGWGEHLSDVYSGILLTEMSALLLFAKDLPEDLRTTYHELAEDLLRIDDFFADGPRVPQIRCYDFSTSKSRVPYRAQTAPWSQDVSEEWVDQRAGLRFMASPFGPLFDGAGWHRIFPAPDRTGEGEERIPLIGGATASSWVGPNIRVGSMSRWPLVEGTDQQEWGLSWQSFPLAFWRRDGDWGFWRFTARWGDDERAHPAFDRNRSYLSNALSTGHPPVVGRTAARQQGANWIALRAVPHFDPNWEEFADGFWLLQATVEPELVKEEGPWQVLRLAYPEGDLFLHHLAICPGRGPQLERQNGKQWSWRRVYGPIDKCEGHGPADLWALTHGVMPEVGPRVTYAPDRAECVVRWPEAGWEDVTLQADFPPKA